MTVSFSGLAKELGEWFWRRNALHAARAQLPLRDQLPGRAFEQVRLLREVARQVADPIEPSAAGQRAAVMLSLCRDQIYWLLVADGRTTPGVDADLAALWRQAPRDKLLRAAGNEAKLESAERLLIGMSPSASLDGTDDDVALVQAFADALYDDLAVPRRRVARVVAQRWLRLLAGALVVLAAAFGVHKLARGPNLAARAPMRVSSSLPGCAADAGCADLMFHTNQEDNPWVEFDLGAPKPIEIIEVGNRPDCCQDRAVPLIAEISLNRVHWSEVGRRDKEFSSWKLKFPRTITRYVRLRVPRTTYFGFASVAVR